MDDAARDKLFRLVRLGKTKEVKEALATGALDVNERDSKGDSLLHLAARNGHKPIVKELLRRNCDFDVKNQAGKEAWELAFDFNFAELGAYIREKTGLPPIGDGGDSAAAALPAPSSKALDSEDFGDVLDLPGLEPKKPLFDPLGAGREMTESNASGGGRESKLSHSDSLLSSSKPSTPPKSIGLAGGKGRGGVTPPPAIGGAAGGTWRQLVDFEVLLSAINALQRGTAIPNEAELHLDTEFFAQIEKVKEAVGLPHAQQRAQGLEGVVETLWARFAAFKEDDVMGVRLQSELRGLRAKMGSGKDVDGVLDERDRLSKSARETERQVADLAGKLRLLEAEVEDSSTRLEEARREAEEYQNKLKAAMRAREAAEAQSREAVARAKDLEVELGHAKDAAAEHRRAIDGVQGTLNEVKRIRVSSLSPAELDDLFKRHDKDNSGDIDATEMKSLVEELCGILERRMEATRADLRREQDRADHAEADRERDGQRAKETEARLTTQLQRLEQDLDVADKSARTQLGQLHDRMDKQKARLDAALEAAKADGEAEVKRVRHEAEVCVCVSVCGCALADARGCMRAMVLCRRRCSDWCLKCHGRLFLSWRQQRTERRERAGASGQAGGVSRGAVQ